MMTGVPSIPNQQQFLNPRQRYGFDPEAASVDTIPAKMEQGDVVLPAGIANMNPQLKAAIAQAIYAQGGDPNRYIAGSPYGNWNPHSGAQHFGFLSKIWKGVKKTVKKIANDPILRTIALTVVAPYAGAAMAGAGATASTLTAGQLAAGYGVTSGALTLAGGGSVKDALISGGTSALGSYASSAMQGAQAMDASGINAPGSSSMFSGEAIDAYNAGMASNNNIGNLLGSKSTGFGSGVLNSAKDLASSAIDALPDSVGNYLSTGINLGNAQWAGYGDTAGTVINAVRNMPDIPDAVNYAQEFATQQLPQAQAMNYLPANQAVNAVTSANTPYTGVANILQNPIGANTKSLADVGVSYMSKVKNRDTGEEEYGDFGSNLSGKARRSGFGGAMLIL